MTHQAVIQVATSVNALHYWPDAPPARFYLAHAHQHTFHIKARALVSHHNRDLEFHDFRDHLSEVVQTMLVSTRAVGSELTKTFGARSCEMIGAELLDLIPSAYEIEVFEDEDCGAIVTRHEKVVN